MRIGARISQLSPFWFGMAVLAILFILVGFGMATWQLFEDPKTIHDRLQATKPHLFGWRMLLLALLIGFWPRLMTWLSRHGSWGGDKLQFAINWRWRAALWLMVIEVGLVQGVAGTFLRHLFQG
jgi:hypothetical protein